MNNWLTAHLLPCPFKYFTGIDCPGCGFQRSLLALLQGNFHESFLLYPATVPVIFTSLFLLADTKYRFNNRRLIRKTLFIFTTAIIAISYCAKITQLY